MNTFHVGDYVEWGDRDYGTLMRGHITEYDYDALSEFNPDDHSLRSYLVLVDRSWCVDARDHGWQGRADSSLRYWWVQHNEVTLTLVGKRPERPFYLVSPVFIGEN